jgi:hypothetical protein
VREKKAFKETDFFVLKKLINPYRRLCQRADHLHHRLPRRLLPHRPPAHQAPRVPRSQVRGPPLPGVPQRHPLWRAQVQVLRVGGAARRADQGGDQGRRVRRPRQGPPGRHRQQGLKSSRNLFYRSSSRFKTFPPSPPRGESVLSQKEKKGGIKSRHEKWGKNVARFSLSLSFLPLGPSIFSVKILLRLSFSRDLVLLPLSSCGG